MPCINFPIDLSLGPYIEIGIAPAASLNPASVAPMGQAPTSVQWIKAIADTGCSVTSVYTGVAQGLSLPVIGKQGVISTTHSIIANVYLCDLFIKVPVLNAVFNYRFSDRQVMELRRQDDRFDALLGMDILSMGMFVTNGPLKIATFSW